MMMSATPSSPSFAAVDTLLQQLVQQHSFPGATAIIADADGLLHQAAAGRHTYDDSAPEMSVEGTYFDVASLTKVVVTTTCAMLLYQWGDLKLFDRVDQYFGPAFTAADPRKALITVELLLSHAAGFPPDPTPVSYCAPTFACPEYLRAPPAQRHLTFSCQHKAFASLNAQRLARAPGEAYVYSDLSMITMMHVVGSVARAKGHVLEGELLPDCVRGQLDPASSAKATAHFEPSASLSQCYYEAFARKFVFSRRRDGAAAAEFMGFRLPPTLWTRAAPTWNDTATGFPGECVAPFRERVLRGEVSDGNAYALGGVAGHAGLFATAPHLHAIMQQILFADNDHGATEAAATAATAATALGINASTVATFTRVRNASFSSRALGWDTLTRPPGAPPGHSLCGNMSARTFMHTGYTGTIICADPVAPSPRAARPGLLSILLTNRVYPRADAQSEHAIHNARIAFNEAVLKALQP
jgi:CubicO group peptidase (beta-lactamase class C family)